MSWKSGRAEFLRGLSLLLAMGALQACNIVQPVPTSAQGGRLSPLLTQQTNEEASTRTLFCQRAAGDPTFAGDLDLAICEVDARRLDYLRQSAQVLNTTAAYNASLWPLGAVALYNMRNGAEGRVLAPALLLGAAQGVVSASMPERQQYYLTAARKLSCAILASTVDLYPQEQVQGSSDHASSSEQSLGAAISDLSQMTREYEKARAGLLAVLKPRPGQGPDATLPFTATVRGRSGISAGEDSRSTVKAETAALLSTANEAIERGQALLRRLEGPAALALRIQASKVDSELQDELSKRAPPPADPASVVESLLHSQTRYTTALAQSGAPASGRATADFVFSERAFSGLNPDSARRLQVFQADKGAPLWGATRLVIEWINRHEAGRAEVDLLLARQGCLITSAPPAAPVALPSATAPREGTGRPATDATANGGSQVRPLETR